MRRPTLVIFVKEPVAGRVKTRLGRDIGMTASAQWFRHQSLSLIRRLARDPRWETVLSVSPDRAGMQSRVWPRGLERRPQGGGHLGARMRRVFVAYPPGPVVLIGGDIPGVTAGHIGEAFRALGAHDAVFGPAEDGGYWLVGLKRLRPTPRDMMERVRWSSPHALADTIATLPRDWRVARVATLGDVDCVADLGRLAAA